MVEPVPAAETAPASAVPCRFFAYPTADGLALFGRDWGTAGADLPVVCLPGVTRNSRDFEALAGALVARGRRVVGLDFRGRGGSAFGPVATYTPAQEAVDTIAALAFLGIPRAHFIGTSRGGLVMMVLSLLRPDLFASAVLNDIGPVIEKAGLARISGYVGVAALTDWPTLIAGLKASQGFLFPSLDEAGWERFARQIYRDDAGVPHLAYDPALSEAFKAFDPNATLPDMWPGFEALRDSPVMVVHGALSDILSADTVAQMAARHPGLTVHTVADEGHAPLLWDAATQDAIGGFIDAANPHR
ncbi:alpha/beta fold hydrolase [Roseixanthobacter liquoris]|uniref:alpha/beta fold hydrolase n=1 Tax=Roseixanthobacter liquoris TaxID=3119921 RepID=UPI0037275101